VISSNSRVKPRQTRSIPTQNSRFEQPSRYFANRLSENDTHKWALVRQTLPLHALLRSLPTRTSGQGKPTL
jgi:hypothetical protein